MLFHAWTVLQLTSFYTFHSLKYIYLTIQIILPHVLYVVEWSRSSSIGQLITVVSWHKCNKNQKLRFLTADQKKKRKGFWLIFRIDSYLMFTWYAFIFFPLWCVPPWIQGVNSCVLCKIAFSIALKISLPISFSAIKIGNMITAESVNKTATKKARESAVQNHVDGDDSLLSLTFLVRYSWTLANINTSLMLFHGFTGKGESWLSALDFNSHGISSRPLQLWLCLQFWSCQW